MPTTDTPGRPRRRALAVVAGCLAVATAGVVALDRYAAAERREDFAGWPADRSRLTPPDPDLWRATPLSPGTPAPDFALPDARTGERVRLGDFRGRPVVLLLSSFG